MKVTIPEYFTQEEFENKIKKVGIENIIHLNIILNEQITRIPYFPRLKILIVSFTNISSIPYMENLEELYCDNCNFFSEIRYFPKLRILSCRRTNILSIPFMENLEVLDCTHCPNILKIFCYPNLKNLYCSIDLKIKFYNKNLEVNWKTVKIQIQYFQGKLYQNSYRAYELLMM